MCRAPAAEAPQKLDDLVGQEQAVGALRTAVLAARRRGSPLGHTLLTGAAGLGKTTLAQALAAEMGVAGHAALGPLLKSPLELVSLLAGLGPREVLFIDEIHALPRRAAEILYQAMAEGRLSLTLAAGAALRTVTLALEPFTLVAATTEPGKLPPPLVSRFRHRHHLKLYGEGELAELLRRAAGRRGLAVDGEAARRIASVARGTPREALRLLEHSCDQAAAAGGATLTLGSIERALAELGIDDLGLGPVDRAYREALCTPGPVSAKRLAAAIGLDTESLERDLEPYLFRLGLATTTPRGRVALGPV